VSRSEIPVFIIGALRMWGRQKRRIWIGSDWHGNIDGYAQSLLGRIRDEREGAGEQGARNQFWPEVFWGAGLDVQRGIIGMRETPLCVLHLHYVWLPEWELTVDQKARSVGIKKADYWRELENAENWAHAKLDSPSDCQQRERPLHVVAKTATTHAQSVRFKQVSVPELNLTALNRSKISIR
jgi:hypothetical protein